MATAPIWPTWFDANYYLNIKADQLNAIGYDGRTDWTAASTEAAFTEQQISVYDHFVAFGKAENISPNAMFNVAEYLASKAKQLNAESYEGRTTWTEAEVMAAFDKAGISAWDHYTQFGMVEGVNPSNQFDTSAYLDAKLANLQATEPTANWTMDSMLAVFKAGNINPLEHFQLYGKTEGLTVPAVAPTEKVVTSFDPYAPASDGTTFTLTTAADNFTGTEKNDVFNGVLSSVSAEGTLNNTDKMDGAAGTADTLNVNMKGDFRGFTTGSMTNIEKVNLTNDSSLSHSFSAKGVTGVDTWNLNAKGAAINLSDLASAEGVTVNVLGQQSGSTTIGFDAKAVEGTKDSLNLGLNGVGTNPDKVVTVNAAEIENLHVKATGDNFVNLAAAAEDSITVNGTGNLNVTGVAGSLTSFDANALSGSVNADLSAATGITTIKGGAGDDNFTIASLGGKAVIEGGAGEDTLTLKGFSGPLAPTMNGIENVVVDGGTVTLVGKNMTGIDTVTLKGGASVTTSGLDATALTLNAVGANTGNATITEATVLTYNTVAKDGDLLNAVSGTVTASAATAATVNIGQHTQVSTDLTLSAAETVTLNVASSKGAVNTEDTVFTGSINAAKAQSLVVDAKGALGTTGAGAAAAVFTVATAKSVSVTAEQGGNALFTAGAATDVSITAGKDFNIKLSNFDKAQNVTLVQNDGKLDGSGIDLKDLNVLTVSGDGKNSEVHLGTLGEDTQKHSLTINASGLKGNFTAEAVNAGANDVTLNFTDVTGNVVLSSVTGQSVVVNAAGMGTTKTGAINAAGDVTINAMGVLGGGKGTVADDDYAFSASDITAGADKTVNISFDGNSDMKFGDVKVGTVGTANTGTININAAGYLGNLGSSSSTANADAVFGTISANTVNIKGAETGSNDFATTANITTNTLTFTGGLGNDLVDMTGFSAGAMSATINTGIGIDKATIKAHGDTTTITVSGDLGGDSVTNGGVTSQDEIIVTGGAKTTGIDIAGLAGYGKSTITHEVLGVATTTITTGAGADTINLKGAGAIDVKLTTGAGDDKVVVTDATGTVKLFDDLGANATTTGDTVSITGIAGLSSVDISTLTGYESSIITSELSEASTQTFKTGDGADTINVKAAATPTDFKVALETGAGKDVVTIIAAAETTDITVTGKMGGNTGDKITVTGKAATDTIDISTLEGYNSSIITDDATAATVIKGGIGIDAIALAHAGSKVVLGTVDAGNIDSISNFKQGNAVVFAGAGADKFTVSADATLSGASDISAAIGLLNDTNFVADAAICFKVGGKVYGVINDGVAGYNATTDAIVEFVGVTDAAALATFTASITAA